MTSKNVEAAHCVDTFQEKDLPLLRNAMTKEALTPEQAQQVMSAIKALTHVVAQKSAEGTFVK